MRSTFTRAFNNLKEEIKKDDCNLEDCKVNLYSLQNTLELKSLDKIIIEYSLEKYISDILIWRMRLRIFKEENIGKLNKIRITVQNRQDTFCSNHFDNESVLSKLNSVSETFKKRFKLPSIEFDKFCGDLIDWL